MMKKKVIIFFVVLGSVLFSYGQDKNDRLFRAIVKNDKDQVKELLADQADPNYIKSTGSWLKISMLIKAVNNENIDIVRLLIDYKADVNKRDGMNTPAIIYSAASGNTAIVNLLLESGADIKADDGQGNTVLSAATESGNKELIALISERLKEQEIREKK